MTLLLSILLLFGLLQLLPAIPAWKTQAVQKLGKAYGPVYGVATLVLFASLIWAFRQANAEPLYDPPAWGRHANFAITLLGFLCIGIFAFRGSWRNSLKYPMSIGVSLWAFGHLLANGDQRSVALFGGLIVIMAVYTMLKHRNTPFVNAVVRQGHNPLSLLGGVALYGIAAQLHYAIAGVALVALR